MKKHIALKVASVLLAGAILAPAFSGCVSPREHRQKILSQMEVVEVDHRGYVRYEGDIIKPGEFARRIRAKEGGLQGKPVLLSVNPEVETNQPEVVPYLRRVLKSVKAGRIYEKIPKEL